MPSQLEHEPDVQQPSVTNLVSGIVDDAQRLVRQQLELFQVEVKNDTRRTLTASIPIVVGLMVGLLAAAMLAVTLAFGLMAIWPQLPAWGAFAVVTGVLAALGGGLIAWGAAKFATFSPLPDQTVEGLKENLTWQTKK